MESDSPDDLSIHGLVDNRRAAAMLGVSVNTFKVWASRASTAKSGIPAAMPAPVASMYGNVYRAADIEAFARTIAFSSRATQTLQRERGAYFTPASASKLMLRWAFRHPGELLLEPSVGDGEFTLAARAHAAEREWPTPTIYACEIDPVTASRAVGTGAVDFERIIVGDYLDLNNIPEVDVVIGNPPFVRIRQLTGRLKTSALESAFLSMGSPMDPSGSAWMPFVSKSTATLRQGGRLAFVLPLDFTYVGYAKPLWRFLGKSFGRLTVVRFRERVFPDILQNVLILLADDRGGSTDHVRFHAYSSINEIHSLEEGPSTDLSINDIATGSRIFQSALLPANAREVLTVLEQHSGPARDRVKFRIGYVSGNKDYFHPSVEQISRYRLPADSLKPTVISSRQLSRTGIDTRSAVPSSVLWLPQETLTDSEREYISAGEQTGVDMAYKCRIRNPWFRVPGVHVPDLILTAFSERPRLHLNGGGWLASNSVLCGYMQGREKARDFIDSWYTPLTRLAMEIDIHSLGGGVMVAVPREAGAVRVLNREISLPLDIVALDEALRTGNVDDAYAVGAKTVRRLVGDEGLRAINEGAEELHRWRVSS